MASFSSALTLLLDVNAFEQLITFTHWFTQSHFLVSFPQSCVLSVCTSCTVLSVTQDSPKLRTPGLANSPQGLVCLYPLYISTTAVFTLPTPPLLHAPCEITCSHRTFNSANTALCSIWCPCFCELGECPCKNNLITTADSLPARNS